MLLSSPPAVPILHRAWYAGTLDAFRSAEVRSILGELTASSRFDVEATQRDAWVHEIEFLRGRTAGLAGDVFLEFSIPRMGARVDAILLVGGIVFVIEFKVGAEHFDRSAIEQAWDYALDLKNFHEPSHALPIVPILVATRVSKAPPVSLYFDGDGVFRPLLVNGANFGDAIEAVLAGHRGTPVDGGAWLAGAYRPTPTIIEAARALYAQHSVEAIARHDAGAENLRVTSGHVEELIAEAKRSRRKMICFVTGVPGAGKTLVGLNVATRRHDLDSDSPAVYLSGNGPLVDVLREALVRDEVAKKRGAGERVRKGQVSGRVKQFIQNVHHFRDDAVADRLNPPVEHVAIFDEAQRAWTQRMTENFMLRKKNISGFDQSEPEFLLSYMDRHRDWSVVVCLVGGGQEINTGEAGIDAWLQAVQQRFPDWEMHISSRLTDSEYAAGHALDALRSRSRTAFDDCLHLGVSMRSFRAENVSAFVKAVLDLEHHSAGGALELMAGRYPLVITRSLDAAKEWVRAQARGSERYGLLASSKAQRLKPHAIDVRVKVDPVSWFLNEKDDTRSSFYLEDAGTEFQVQGLELDWTCVTWDADLRHHGTGWGFHDFRGSRWQNVNNLENRRYLLNAYRVLLTRARQGMAIFVPPGDSRDHTRLPEFYDGTFRYLREIGLPVIG
jgi:hypothetical protein